MAVVNAAQAAIKTVADPNAAYESLVPLWNKCRAVCSGERFVKDLDSAVGVGNMLIPFSPSMSQAQYNFYKSEAELPGIVSQFARMLVGGLLRKQPTLSLPDGFPEEGYDWIMNEFGQDGSSLSSVLDVALWEEMQTSRAWIFVDYPAVDGEQLPEDRKKTKPYPVIQNADTIINWQVDKNSTGGSVLTKVLVKGAVERYEKNEFHPTFHDCVYVHELDENGLYRVRVYERESPVTEVTIISGQRVENTKSQQLEYKLVAIRDNILVNGERINFIPAWPLNGRIEASEPMLMPVIDKELTLYNKLSRRNHLLYGASTYTPVISGDMTDEQFDDIVDAGLGSWLRLPQGCTATVLETPTAALADMDRAIAASIEEMAKMGIRMLSPESAQSGIALQIRNAAQTAQLGTLNTKVSNTLRQVILFMLNWHYDADLELKDISFEMSSDFSPMQAGPDWLRLATEWYQASLIPRSVWLILLKQNDILPPDYNDEAGRQEITEDMEDAMKGQGSDDFANKLEGN